MKKLLLSLLAISLLVLTACVPADSSNSNAVRALEGDTLASDLQRAASPEVSNTDQKSLADGNTELALELLAQLKNEDENLVYSPYSISLALAMTYAGARDDTQQQMADTLHFNLGQAKLHPAFNWLNYQLAQREANVQGEDDEELQLNIVNAIWGQLDYEFLVDFLDVLAHNYGTGLRGLDFINEPEESRITINDWVSQQTEGRIQDLIPQGAINALTRLVLTNAIYFKATWQHLFYEESTYADTFYLLDGSQISVDMMHQVEQLGYSEGSGYQAVELKYSGAEMSMVTILPEAGSFTAFESSLDAAGLEGILDDIEDTRVTLSMPKFNFASDFNLKNTLSAMGMADAFSGSADFSGMTNAEELFISDVVHKAFISVDENGTEAAAATAVMMAGSAPMQTASIDINSPFIFLIRDIPTNTILFMGQVLNPSE